MRRSLLGLLVLAGLSWAWPDVGRTQPSDARDPEVEPRAKVTFMGFQQHEDKSSRLFVHFAGEPVDVTVVHDGVRAVYTIAGTHIGTRNNRNPLNLEHFDALLVRAQMRQVESAVELALVLRKPFQTKYQMDRRGDGGLVLEIRFPPP